MSSNDRDLDPIERAVINLLNSKQGIFYSSLILMMKRVPMTIKQGAMGVGFENGQVRLVYDPDWVGKMTVQQVMFCLEHECVTAGTFIAGANKSIENLKPGDLVLDTDGKMTEVKEVMNRDFKGQLYTIKSTLVPTFETTFNHPLLVSEYRGKTYKETKRSGYVREFKAPEFVQADQLKVCTPKSGHYLLFPKVEKRGFDTTLSLASFTERSVMNKVTEIKLTEELAWTLGFYTAEGYASIGHSGPLRKFYGRMSFACHESKDNESIAKISNYFKSLGYDMGVLTRPKTHVKVIQLNSPIFARAFSTWCGKGAINKQIPEFIMYNKDEKILRAFLDGFWKGDGYKRPEGVAAGTASRTLAYQLQLAILSLGESAGVSIQKENLSNIVHKSRPLYTVRWTKKQHHVKDLVTHWGVPIEKIMHKEFNGKVYNIETGTNTYTINNVGSHNCLHLVLDHLSRMGDRDSMIWNLAADCAVNGYILEDPGPCVEPYEIVIPGKKDSPFENLPKGKHAEWYYDQIMDKAEKYTVTKNADGSITVKNEKTGKSQTYKPNSHDEWETMEQGDSSLNKEIVKVMVKEAYSEAKQRGSAPGGAVAELIESLLQQNTVNWKSLLRRYIAASMLSSDRKSSWKRVNRRFDTDYPGSTRIRQPKIWVHFDTSGSMDDASLMEGVAELRAIQKIYNASIQILEGDTQLEHEYSLAKFAKVSTAMHGRGGTSHKYLWKYLESKTIDLLICFTDMASDIESSDKPRYPVIFVTPSNMSGHKIEPPFGRLIEVNKK